MRKLYLVLILALVVSLLAGCAPTPPAGMEFPAGATRDFQVVWKAGWEALKSSPKFMSPDDLNKLVSDSDANNDPWLLDVRKPEDNAKGAIPGTKTVILWTDIPKPENLAKLPKDKDIWLYCNTGNTVQPTLAMLTMLGYKGGIVSQAIMAWTKDTGVLTTTSRFDPAAAGDYKMEKDIVKPSKTYPLPQLATTGATAFTNEGEVIRQAADDANKRVKVTTADAKNVFADMASGDAAKIPTVVDTRKPEDYAKGHIAGAFNIQQAELLKPDNLNKLPPDKPIVLVDYIGSESHMGAMVLRMLGYDASSLRWGMMAWTKDDTALGPYKRYGEAQQRDFKLVKK